ncbi:uncharacterized protein A1O9_05232 [Exophiala aquamarina CBS 119918]|uniref:Xylanolytic transcriptional activator regulatory domain-containing protein n=1 Tax=Exophiala aquamarina CBS 119918 TaxID=1182545 RepID=A0A072PPA7_9EURO|nr:uncharacterized protein A1O9_05232 [Exophiala aquamarina CBS 119918]KEF57315.1 hypothetical protein A1O9_05232 [Exophiala aquamarina CBS 119918]
MHEGSELPNDIPPRSLLKTAGQILVTGQYQKARPYSVEAVLLFGICKFLQKVDPDTEPWLVIGVAARMALRMGYHRDPQYLPHISPFQGEMRRRTFSILQAFDLLLSFQAGLPATLHEDACDTDLPRNLFDEDFDEDSTVIPPSRPLTVPTPMIYHCFKGRLCRSFRPVARLALSPRAPSYEDIMKADAELRKAHASIPPSLAMRPLSLSITDEVHVIQHRFNVDLVYQTGMMILHRTYISHQRSNPTFEYSRKTCIKASLSMLKWQADLHLATLPGGQLHNSSRFIASSLIQHDFLLAAMVACLDLYESHRRSEIDKITDAEFEAHKDIYNALKFSHQIWMSRSSSSRDAKRASAILGVMMAKIPDPSVARGSKTNTLPAGSFDQDHSVLGSTTPGMLTLSLSPFPKEQAQPFTSILENEETGFSESGAFEALLRDEEVNWNLVDQYLFGRGAGLDEFWMREL